MAIQSSPCTFDDARRSVVRRLAGDQDAVQAGEGGFVQREFENPVTISPASLGRADVVADVATIAFEHRNQRVA